jgi:iron complex transport system ATP-binding protein
MGSCCEILKFHSLVIGYDQERALLPELSGSAHKGEITAIIGKNGVGKSTLLRTFAGIQEPLGGEILYDGEPVNKINRNNLARIVSFTSTEILKISNMRVFDLVALGRFPYTNWFGTMTAGDRKIVIDAMEKTSVSTLAERFVAELSDGERQKAMIARMIAQDTSVMLMDEPTAFLDVRSKFEVMELLLRLAHEDNKTVIFSTHDLNMAVSHSDNIWLIIGSSMKNGAPEDLMLNGSFDHLFESSSVGFNPESGTYSLKPESRGFICIKGWGARLRWTVEGLKRAGFLAVNSLTSPYVNITNDKWQLVFPDSVKECYSVYDLIRELRNLSSLSGILPVIIDE